MPQTSYQYAIGRIKALENKILDSYKLKKIALAEFADFFKLLQEFGYGGGNIEQHDLEKLAKKELDLAKSTVWEITPEPEITKLFFLSVDAHNLKVLFKARILATSADELLESGGVFPIETLIKCVSDKSYFFLPEAIKMALEDLEKNLLRNSTPRYISSAIDKAIFNHIKQVLKEKPDLYAIEYFGIMADLTNVRTLIRARILKWEADVFSTLIVTCGSIEKQDLLAAFSLPDEQLAFYLNKGAYSNVVFATIEEYTKTNDVTALEKAVDKALMQFAKKQKNNTSCVAPVVGFLLAKTAEAKALHSIFAAKKIGKEPELPELYM